MILRKLTVKRLRAIKDAMTVDLAPGLNIIKGKNEAGKSSLRLAITKALFQDPTTTSRDVLSLTSWGHDQGWEVSLDFDAGKGTYHVTKSLQAGTGQLVSPSESITNRATIAARLMELSGCPSELFFESTACIGQDEMVRLIPERTTDGEKKRTFGLIAKRLQAAISGAVEANVPELVARLYAKTHRVEAKGPYAALRRASDERESLLREKTQQEQKVDQLLENRRRLIRLEEELMQISAELPQEQEIIKKNSRVTELQAAIEEYRSRHSALERAKELKVKVDDLDRQLQDQARFSGSETLLKLLDQMQIELQALEQQRLALQTEIKTVESAKRALWMPVSGLLLAVAGLAGIVVTPYLASLAVAGLIPAVYWLSARRTRHRNLMSLAGREKGLTDSIQSRHEAMKESIAPTGCRTHDDLRVHFGKYKALRDQHKEAQDKLSGILGDTEWKRFVEDNAGLAMMMAARREEMDQLLTFRLGPLDLQRLSDEVSSKQRRQRELEAEKAAIEKFFLFTDADTDQVTAIEERLAWLDQEKSYWSKQLKVYDLTREMLQKAHEETLFRAAGVLEAELGKYVAAVTESRYTQVRVDEKDLSIQAFSTDKNDWVDIRELSRATQDQFYICARLALVGLVTEGKRPPLLLDDPFVNFDTGRLRQMISLLQKLAVENQILLFTCSDIYDQAGNLVEMK